MTATERVLRIGERAVLMVLALPGISARALPDDCNLNGAADAAEILQGQSADCNQDGIPDDCELAPPGVAFQQAAEFGLPPFPASFLAGDFTGDGEVDLAAAFPNSSSELGPAGVSVFPSNGDGTFAPQIKSAIGVELPFQTLPCAAADLDGDGDLDLAMTNVSLAAGGIVLVLFHQGRGAFSPAQSFPLPGFISPGSPVVADFDLDGDLDLAALQTWAEKPNEVQLLMNDGARGFSSAGISSFAQFSNGLLIAGDFNGDAYPDLADANLGSNAVSVSLNNKKGAFPPARNYPVGHVPIYVISDDLDGDADLDLITSDNGDFISAMISALKNRGDGTFSAPERFPVGGASFGERPVTGDFDGDGKTDVALVNSGNVSVLRNKGEGKLSEPVHYLAPGGPLPNEPLAADLNGDGRLDLAALVGNRVALLFNEGEGDFRAQRVLMMDFNPAAMTSGDFDGDGRLDLASANRPGRGAQGADFSSLSLFRNIGEGQFDMAETLVPSKGSLGPLISADLDGDKDLDLAVATVQVVVALNDGKGSMTLSSSVDVGGAPGPLVALDLDGDRDLDLAVEKQRAAGSPAGGLAFLINSGSGRFEPGPILEVGDDISSLAAADFDADGVADLAAAIPFHVAVVFHPGALLDEPSLIKIEVGSNPVALAVGDLDGDGDPDLASANHLPEGTEEDNVSVMLNAGGRSFRPPRNFVVGRGASAILPADIDGDGDLDLASVNSQSEDVFVLLNRGDGFFARRLSFGAGRFPVSLAIGDIDGDKKLDLAIAGEYQISLLLNQVKPEAGGDSDENGILDACERAPFHRGDANGDGKLDTSDPISIFLYLFAGAAGPGCRESADADNDGRIDISDGIAVLLYLFQGGKPPVIPGPPGSACGLDPDPPGSVGDLGCEEYRGCGA